MVLVFCVAMCKWLLFFVVPVFHREGDLTRDENGLRVYLIGNVKRFDEMDIDFVNHGGLVKLLKELGFKTHKSLYRYDDTLVDLDFDWHKIEGDEQINQMCDNVMARVVENNEFHIFVEHDINVHVPATFVEVHNVEIVVIDDDSSSSDDEYETTRMSHINLLQLGMRRIQKVMMAVL
ncbi:hypothetical protein PIB30_083350 [Stylosanthes scabra]|uniref:PB1-like domain-containing protein n=1 Tax=Stylosanthes scabra TaxID=79078 RepID=A0ABU6STL7_9FABA|nr:hypothetical protein [Stylosanthes scabra]